MSTKVIYIAGPFRAPDAWRIEQNIRRAEALSLEVWRIPGYCAVCPHTNTRFFQGAAPDDVWLAGDLAILRKCDGVLLTEDWLSSSGARAEVEFANENLIPVFYTLKQMQEHFRVG